MSQVDTTVHPDALELAALLRPSWPAITAHIAATRVPVCEGEPATTSTDGDTDGDTSPDGGDAAAGAGQKTYDESYVRTLRREAAQHRTQAKEFADKLKALEDRDKSEQQKAIERAEAAEQRAQAAESRLLRADVAAEKGVPAKLAKFLTGSTKRELEQSADELLEELGGSRRTSLDGGTREGDTQRPQDLDAAIRRAAGRT